MQASKMFARAVLLKCFVSPNLHAFYFSETIIKTIYFVFSKKKLSNVQARRMFARFVFVSRVDLISLFNSTALQRPGDASHRRAQEGLIAPSVRKYCLLPRLGINPFYFKWLTC